MSGRLCCKKSNKVKAFLLLLCFIHHCSPVKSFHSEEKLSPDIDVLLIPLTLQKAYHIGFVLALLIALMFY